MFAVHGGAGYHNKGVEKYCRKAVKIALQNSNIVDGVAYLEDISKFNCGYGSNLTKNGRVECDAAVMISERYIFGGVAVVDCLKNPVKAAQNIVSNLMKNDDWDVTPPMVISGNGINDWAKENNFIIISNDELISDNAKNIHNSIGQLLSLDTCGGCSITKSTEISSLSCVSSGGVAFKQDGRIGHSIMFGAAIWSERTENGQCISISISGFGEAIYRTHLAQKISKVLFKADNNNEIFCSVIQEFLKEEFLNSPQNSLFPSKRLLCGGIILFLNSNTNHSEIISFHNTPNFVFAFSDGQKAN
ncbi:Threonine aspartase 1 [Strongyloides ratti]|uniref:Threonine aspartase 1 n=1 Tax=Strongyloides ratti TaxID=34506 RepID=A0A090LG00_STRRB|nr:Threonine aspartase 1 [Strongyloides ratti]CEF66445.1 Threonine aspartase 1 [Strongyloides ratti]